MLIAHSLGHTAYSADATRIPTQHLWRCHARPEWLLPPSGLPESALAASGISNAGAGDTR